MEAAINPYNLTWIKRSNIQDILSFDTIYSVYCWNYEKFAENLKQRNVIGKLLMYQDKIAGYMIYRLGPDDITIIKLGYNDKNHLEHICINLKDRLRVLNKSVLRYMARETDLETQLCLSSIGFNAVGVARNHFEDTGEDAYEFLIC